MQRPAQSVRRAAGRGKRAADREAAAAGMRELNRWLQDLVRRRLATVQREPPAFWEGMAARMVDAQAPGIARVLRDVSAVMVTGAGCQDRVIERL